MVHVCWQLMLRGMRWLLTSRKRLTEDAHTVVTIESLTAKGWMERSFQRHCLEKYDYHSEVIYIQGKNSKDFNTEHSRLFREWITFSAKSEIFLTML